MKRILCFVCSSLMAFTMVMGQAGSTCQRAYNINQPLTQSIVPSENGVWFKSSTYYLPVKVYYTPDTPLEKDEWPYAYVDFSCTGKYDDDLLNIIDAAKNAGKELPVMEKLELDSITPDGKQVYSKNISTTYRNIIVGMGVTRDVEAVVQMFVPRKGTLAAEPDMENYDCINESEWLKMGSNFTILANDSDRHFVMPVKEWEEDSVAIYWHGRQAPAYIWMGYKDCDFTPKAKAPHVLRDTLFTIEPGSYIKLTEQYIDKFLKYDHVDGIVYAKILSDEQSELEIMRAPSTPPTGDAVVLTYGKTYTLDENKTYCIFTNKRNYLPATLFTLSGTEEATITLGSQRYSFTIEKENSTLGLGKTDLKALTDALGSSNYLYINFDGANGRELNLTEWADAPDYIQNTILLQNGEIIEASPSKESATYRIHYADWKNQQILVENEGNTSIGFGIYNTPTFNLGVKTNNNQLDYIKTLAKKSNKLYNNRYADATVVGVSGWNSLRYKQYHTNDSTDNGYLFIRIKNNESGVAAKVRISGKTVAQQLSITPNTITFSDEKDENITISVTATPTDAADAVITWSQLTEEQQAVILWDEETRTLSHAKEAYYSQPIQLIASTSTILGEPALHDTLTITLPAKVDVSDIVLPDSLTGITLRLDSGKTSLHIEPIIQPAGATNKSLVWTLTEKTTTNKTKALQAPRYAAPSGQCLERLACWDDETNTLTLLENKRGGTVILTATSVSDPSISLSIEVLLMPYGEFPYSICAHENRIEVTNQPIDAPNIKITDNEGHELNYAIDPSFTPEDYYEVELTPGRYTITDQNSSFVVRVL